MKTTVGAKSDITLQLQVLTGFKNDKKLLRIIFLQKGECNSNSCGLLIYNPFPYVRKRDFKYKIS